ncbi:hypothetical protein [Streptomyces ardesiacus]|uniref:hypothetical protein n=1 Tax=Streptomyces ardesiacus TaxID=285564 RepID=UPI0036764A1F
MGSRPLIRAQHGILARSVLLHVLQIPPAPDLSKARPVAAASWRRWVLEVWGVQQIAAAGRHASPDFSREIDNLVTELRRRLPPGSVISFTHLLAAPPPHATTPLVRRYREAGIGLRPRDLAVITASNGTWPAYTHGPHTGAGSPPVCALLLRSPGPGRFTRPAFWSPSRRGAVLHSPPSRRTAGSNSGAKGAIRASTC